MRTSRCCVIVLVLFFAGWPSALGQTPSPTPDPRVLDLAPSGLIDSDDLQAFALHWQEEETDFGPVPGDFDGSGRADANDLLSLLLNWKAETGPGEILTIPIPGLPAGSRPLRLVRIPAGTFQMGSPEGELSRRPDEGPVHMVTITRDFYIGETEVTQAQWKALMGTNPATDLGAGQYGVGNDYPVYYVSWIDITRTDGFLSRLNSQSAYNSFRLPTEAEWEYACRAGTSTRFSFGDNQACDETCGPCSLADQYMVWCGNHNVRAEQVASRLPNDFGLYDMHGNLWEWCEDWYQSNFYGTAEARIADPLCANSFSRGRVVRGCDWFSPAGACRSANRGLVRPSSRFFSNGVRVVLPVSP